MIAAARTLERVLLVTRNHLGFVWRYLDQVRLSAALRTPHDPFISNRESVALSLSE
jgi:hypothetical protein